MSVSIPPIPSCGLHSAPSSAPSDLKRSAPKRSAPSDLVQNPSPLKNPRLVTVLPKCDPPVTPTFAEFKSNPLTERITFVPKSKEERKQIQDHLKVITAMQEQRMQSQEVKDGSPKTAKDSGDVKGGSPKTAKESEPKLKSFDGVPASQLLEKIKPLSVRSTTDLTIKNEEIQTQNPVTTERLPQVATTTKDGLKPFINPAAIREPKLILPEEDASDQIQDQKIMCPRLEERKNQTPVYTQTEEELLKSTPNDVHGDSLDEEELAEIFSEGFGLKD